MSTLDFREIEHKFVVSESFDRDDFRRRLRALGPERETTVETRDVYYLLDRGPRHVYRHRHDRELQHLSVKSLGDDPENRLEINLDLGQHRGDQTAAVEAFMAVLGVVWRGEIRKESDVYYFPDCEVVWYRAAGAGRVVHCVEVEAVGAPSLDAARAVLARYETALGLDALPRSAEPLVALLYPDFAS